MSIPLTVMFCNTHIRSNMAFIYKCFLTDDKKSATDFLQIEKEKTVRISFINDARSAKENVGVLFSYYLYTSFLFSILQRGG